MTIETTQKAYDDKKADAFVGKVLGDTVGLTTTALAFIGDELGLWKDLHSRGAATSEELARRTRLAERPLREWLSAMASAGYLHYEPTTRRFELPAEHAPVLAKESGPVFFGGVHQEFVSLLRPIDRILDSFRSGNGVPQSAYPDGVFDGMDRFTAGSLRSRACKGGSSKGSTSPTWAAAADARSSNWRRLSRDRGSWATTCTVRTSRGPVRTPKRRA